MYEVEFRVPAPRGRGRYAVGEETLTAFVIRETTGKDEEYAAERAKQVNGSLSEELIRVSLVSVNGAPAQQPYLKLGEWNSKARSLLAEAFKEVNSVSDDEGKDFHAAGGAGDPAAEE